MTMVPMIHIQWFNPFSKHGRVGVGFNRKDKHYRRYASGVERALSLFDTALQEWADYISFLGRLLKVSAIPLYMKHIC